MKLILPEGQKCPDKTIRYPITKHNPARWLKTEYESYCVFGIDGFIVNRDKKVNGIFKKLEYVQEGAAEDITIEDIKAFIAESELLLLQQLADVLECKFYTFIW